MSLEDKIPHVGLVTVQAIVHKQLPNGQFSPESVFFETFSLGLEGSTKEECTAELKKKLEQMKEQWQKK